MIEIIVHKYSGHRSGEKCLKEIIEFSNAKNLDIRVHETEYPGHAEALAKELSEAGTEKLAVIGGDGTFHEVLNGLDLSAPTRLGFIPAGRGNDYVFGTGYNTDTISAFKDVLSDDITTTDFIQVSSRRCLNVCGTGLDVSVLERTEAKKTKVSYVSSLAVCLLKFKPFDFTVTSPDFETFRGKAIMVGACNGTQFGGGIKLCPVSLNNDGLLDVIIMQKPKNVPVLLVMPKFVKGKHMGLPYTKHYKCTSLSVETPVPIELDGEIYTDLKFEASVVKNGLKTFVPHKYLNGEQV